MELIFDRFYNYVFDGGDKLVTFTFKMTKEIVELYWLFIL